MRKVGWIGKNCLIADALQLLHPQIKLQRLRRLWIWTFGFLVHQINSAKELLWQKQNFQKMKQLLAKTPFFVIDPFCTPFCTHSTSLNIGFWVDLFGNETLSIWSFSTKKWYSSFLKKVFVSQKICFKVKVLKMFEISSGCHIKTECLSLKTETILKIHSKIFLVESLLFPFALNWNLSEKAFSYVNRKTKSNFLWIFVLNWKFCLWVSLSGLQGNKDK